MQGLNFMAEFPHRFKESVAIAFLEGKPPYSGFDDVLYFLYFLRLGERKYLKYQFTPRLLEQLCL